MSVLGKLDDWKRLADGSHDVLLAEAAAARPHDVGAIDRLRRTWSAEMVRLALMLAEARRKARPKFGSRADSLWADPQGVEMASSALAAGFKAARFVDLTPAQPVVDLCCGIGGDAIGLASAGARVIAVDSEPIRAWMAEVNAECDSMAADAADDAVPEGPFHIDPARRDEASGRRAWRYEDLRPSPEVLATIIARRGDGAVKLGPGVDMHALPPGEVEVISEDGRLTQAVLWIGALARGRRTATLLREGYAPETLRGVADAPTPVGALARYIFEADAAPERAGLLSTLCETVGAPMLHERIGLLTHGEIIESPWLTPFEALDRTAWNQRRIAAMLRERGAGIVEVKTRGGIVNPDELQPALSGRGDNPLVLFVLRFGKSVEAIIARRVTPPRPQGPSLAH